MSDRTINLHAFCSAKGGVGKSTLAVALGQLLSALEGREAVVVDADLLGTSLADGLDICAPAVEEDESGALLLHAPPTGRHYSIAETRARRARRFRREPSETPPQPRFLPYFNDLLTHVPSASVGSGRTDALL